MPAKSNLNKLLISSQLMANYATFIPTYFRSLEQKVPYMELSLPGTFANKNFRSRERKWCGTFAPRNFHSLKLSLPQPK